MDNNLFTGNLVRLVIDESQTLGKAVSHWARDTEFMRLQDSYPARLFSVQKCQAFVETDDQATQGKNFLFYIRTLDDNLLIGDAGLTVIQWTHKEAYLGIGIGERACWDQGYGTDAVRVLLRYAFDELNLWRITLNVFAYNPRAIRCYEKCGFRHEGRQRGRLNREGQHWDLIYMGIIRTEWERLGGNGVK